MAYIDILAQSNYMSVSKKAAKIFGLNVAAYLSELVNVAVQVKKKKSADENGFFKLNREYMRDETTLDFAQQLECDAILKMSGIVDYKNQNDPIWIGVDLQALTAILAEEDLSKIEVVNKLSKEQRDSTRLLTKKLNDDIKAEIKQKAAEEKRLAAEQKKLEAEQKKAEAEKRKAEKDAAIRDRMKFICAEFTSDLNVQTALSKWVDSIYDSRRFLNRDKITSFITKIKSFSSDAKVQIGVIDVAMQQSWVEADWAINSYNRTNNITAHTPTRLGTQKIISNKSEVSRESF